VTLVTSYDLRNLLRMVGDAHTGRLESRDLFRGGARTALDDRPRVSHPLARRRGLAGDKGSDRLGHSASNSSRQSMNPVPFTASPPIPTQVLWPMPRKVSAYITS